MTWKGSLPLLLCPMLGDEAVDDDDDDDDNDEADDHDADCCPPADTRAASVSAAGSASSRSLARSYCCCRSLISGCFLSQLLQSLRMLRSSRRQFQRAP